MECSVCRLDGFGSVTELTEVRTPNPDYPHICNCPECGVYEPKEYVNYVCPTDPKHKPVLTMADLHPDIFWYDPKTSALAHVMKKEKK